MISGAVTGTREAVIWLKLRGTNGLEVEVQAVVDTGFLEFLALPPTWIEALALPQIRSDELVLANDQPLEVAGHTGVVVWDGRERSVIVHCLEGNPLIGMALLWDHLLSIQVTDGGPVTITAAS